MPYAIINFFHRITITTNPFYEMYKDIISYELAEGISEEHLLKVAQEVHESWMKKQKGFISWEITKDAAGNLIDIVSWESRQAAKEAEKDMGNIPNSGKWFACYKEGCISSKNVSRLKRF